jgi:hypothetical protein
MPAFSQNLNQSLRWAAALSQRWRHECATSEHLLLALTDDSDAVQVMQACNVDLQKLRDAILASLSHSQMGRSRALRRALSPIFNALPFTQTQSGLVARATSATQRDILIALSNVRFSNRPVMGWTRRALASCSRKPAWGCENQEHSMPRATSRTNLIATIGIDIGKNTFHVIGLDDKGAIILRQKLTRGQVYARLANIPPCLIGMEACVGAHHLGRQLSALGHDTRLMPARYVRPFRKARRMTSATRMRLPRLCSVRP